jgi:DNA gyrase subunit B
MDQGEGAPADPGPARVYDCGSIQVLEGLEPVRRRPGMYVGDTRDGSGLHHLAHELFDNAVQEHVDGRCFRLAVTLHAGGALTVEDDGPGIPVDPPPGWKLGASPLEVIFTRLCAGGFGRRGLSGLLGVGVACVNALSEQLVVEVRRGGWLHRQSFRRGLPEGPPAGIRRDDGTGTRVTIHPDPQIFASTAFDPERLLRRLREIAFLHPGLSVDFVDERRGGRRTRLHGRGIAAWVSLLTEGRSVFPAEPIRLRGAREGLSIDLAFQWTRASTEWQIWSFADLQPLLGGSHLLGLRSGVGQAIKAASRGAEGLGDRRPWRPGTLRAGLVGVIDLRGPAVTVDRCCRAHVRSAAVKAAVREIVASGLADVLERQPDVLGSLVDACVRSD